MISTRPLRASTSAPLRITDGASGTNRVVPGSLTSTVPRTGWAPTLVLRTGVGIGVGVGVTTGVAVGVTTGVAVGVGSGGGGWYSNAPASQVVSCGRATPRWSSVRPPQSATSTAELFAGIFIAGGCRVSSGTRSSCGSVWTPPRLHWSVSGVTLPPPSIAPPPAIPQFAGPVIGP